MNDSRVLDLLAAQHWVASDRQLLDLGISEQSIRRAVRAGLLARPLIGVVVLPARIGAFETRAMALQLGLGRAREGFLSGPTAARLYGLRSMPSSPVEYTIRIQYRPIVPAWARLVRSSWPDRDERPARDDGFVLASPLRMLFGLAARLPAKRFRRAAEDAWHLGLVTPESASDYLARIRRSGRTGVARFEEWLEFVSSQRRPPQTGLEQFLVELAGEAGLPRPELQHPLPIRPGVCIHLDLAWPDIRLAVEPGHSWWHGGDAGQRADQDRARECAESGWHLHQVDESARARRADIVSQLGRIYRERARLFPEVA